jgi:hypothetical protein
MSVWRKRFEKGDSELRKTNKGNEALDFEAWDILFSDFVKKIGLDPDFESYLENIKTRINEQNRYIQSTKKDQYGTIIRDRSILNRIKYLDALIQDFEKTGSKEKTTISQMLNRLSKMQGGAFLAEDAVTVERYFDLIKDYKEWVKN